MNILIKYGTASLMLEGEGEGDGVGGFWDYLKSPKLATCN